MDLSVLNLVHDNRSGNRLEIVVPTFNEERKIGNILKCYGQDFDVVLLDDGSTDNTVAIAIEAGASVYTRMGETVGENHFVHYVNEVSKSGYCFYMFADEFIKKSELHAAFSALKVQPCVILGKRIDWAYGKRIVSPSSSTPRGLCKGSAIYNPNRLHASLEYIKAPAAPRVLEFDVHHLHIWSMKDYFGQAGKYAYLEVEQFRKQAKPILHLLRRYAISELLMLPRRLWRERKQGVAFLFWMFVMSLTVSLLAVLSWLEQRFLNRPEEQLQIYAKFYVDTQ